MFERHHQIGIAENVYWLDFDGTGAKDLPRVFEGPTEYPDEVEEPD